LPKPLPKPVPLPKLVPVPVPVPVPLLYLSRLVSSNLLSPDLI
jgi:hypothetical protein